jgi:hypothetical protein
MSEQYDTGAGAKERAPSGPRSARRRASAEHATREDGVSADERSDQFNTAFSLPSIDDDPDTELGVLLMGLGPERLLAGLGVASGDPGADAAAVTLLVDQLRHGVRPGETFENALAAGAARWRVAREGFATLRTGTGRRSAALRRLWESAADFVDAGAAVAPQLRTAGGAERVYLIACWTRLAEITRIMEEHGVPPEVPT